MLGRRTTREARREADVERRMRLESESDLKKAAYSSIQDKTRPKIGANEANTHHEICPKGTSKLDLGQKSARNNRKYARNLSQKEACR